MKKIKFCVVGVSVLALIALPALAEAHWRGGGRVVLGFGAGLLAGYLIAPRPAYVAPPVYAAPPPAYVPAPPPQAPGICREWRMIDRRLENRWDPYAGRWQSIPVERWGWVEAPCY